MTMVGNKYPVTEEYFVLSKRQEKQGNVVSGGLMRCQLDICKRRLQCTYILNHSYLVPKEKIPKRNSTIQYNYFL